MANEWLNFERQRLALDRERKTTVGGPNPNLSFDQYLKEQAELEGLSMEELYPEWNYDATFAEGTADLFGQLAWSFADEYTLGALGMIDEYKWMDPELSPLKWARDPDNTGWNRGSLQWAIEEGRDLLQGEGPTTYAGKTGATVGTVAGFIVGAPMKVVKGAGMLIKGGLAIPRRIAGKRTAEGMIKKGMKETAKLTAKDPSAAFVSTVAAGAIRSAVHVARRPGSLNDTVKFVKHVHAGIDDSVARFVTSGAIDSKKGLAIAKSFKKYFTDRPVESFVDLLTSRMVNKKMGYGIGSMIQEGIMFGTLDAAREAVHHYGSGGEREWDWANVAWGAGVGMGFGMLKWLLPRRGISSVRKEDFRFGLKSYISRGRGVLKKDNFDTLKGKSKWLGADAKVIGEEVVPSVKFGGKKYNFDLTKPESETIRILKDMGLNVTKEQQANILRKVLQQQTGKWGSRLIKWSNKNEWASIQENWRRMLFGTGVMNMRTIADTFQGQPIGVDDVILNVLVGAYLNKGGHPRAIDMFPEQMNRLRAGLHRIGIVHPGKANPFTVLPSMDPASSSSMNPFANDRLLNDIVKFAEEKGITTNNFDGIDNPVLGLEVVDPLGPKATRGISANMSGENLVLFNEFYRYLHGASTKKYVLNKDSITETTALEIQKKLEKQFDTLTSMRDYMETVVDKSVELFEGEIVQTASELMLALGYRVGNKTEGNIGELPFEIMFDNNITELAAQDRLGEVIPSFEGVKNQSKVLSELHSKMKNVFNTVHEMSRASKRTKDQVEIVEDNMLGHEKLEKLMRIVSLRESTINNELGLTKTGSNSFDFNKVYNMQHYLKNRIVKKKVEVFSKILDIESVDSAEIQSRFIDSGVFQTGVPGIAELSVLRDVSQIRIVNADGSPIKNSNLINEHKMFIGSILGVLHAKGQYKKYIGNPVDISVDQIRTLQSFLNRKGINTKDPLSLQEFTMEVSRRISLDNFAKSNLNNQQIGVFRAFYGLGNPDIGGGFSLMRYADFKGIKSGIEVAKIEYLGTDTVLKDIVKEYNNFVDQMHRDGKVPGSKDNFVSVLDKPYIINNDPTLLTIQSVLHDAIFRTNQSSTRELVDFLVADIKETKARDASLTFLQSYPQYAAKLVKLLIHQGALGLKKGEGDNKHKWDYIVNTEKWENVDTQSKVLKFVERHGINLDTVDMMSNNAKEQLKNYIDSKYDLGDHKASIPIQTFFNKYIPAEAKLTPEKMNQYIMDTLFDSVTQEFRGVDAIRDLLEIMEYKNSDQKLAYEHAMQVIGNKLESKPQRVFYYQDGSVKFKDTDLQSYKTPFFSTLDAMGIKYALVDGMTMSWSVHPLSSKIQHAPLDIFQEKSNLLTGPEIELITSRKTVFMKLLRAKTDAEGFFGVEIIEMPGMSLGVAINKADFHKVQKAFTELYNRNINHPDISTNGKDKLEFMKESLERQSNWTKSTESAMRLIIGESMTVGSNKNLFVKMLDMTSDQLTELYVGRQTLFNTMKFKRINAELMGVHNTILKGKEKSINTHYMDKGGFGVAILDDSMPSWQLREIFEDANPKDSWTGRFGDRKNESSVDSITFISKRMADFLGLHYGASGSRIFKPVISSQGESTLIYGKTAFVYNPKYDAFFNNNPELDILMTKSAEKLKLYDTNEILQINKKELLNNGGQYNVGDKLLTIPLDAIGVTKVVDHFAPAKLAPSVIQNHTDIDLAQKLYNDYYAVPLEEAIKNVRSMLENPFMEHEFIRQLKAGMTPGELQDLNFTDGANQWTGLHLEWLNTSPYASIDVFGPGAKMNPIKSKYIDEVLAPKSEYKTSKGERIKYGAKSTLLQDGTDLEATLFNLKTGTIDRYGEVRLPADVGAEGIDFAERNFKIKVINTENNEVLDAKEIFLKEFITVGMDAEAEWNRIANGERPLETLFNRFESGPLSKYDLAISTMRYPRTRPNDLTLLRLRGFLDPEMGNGMMVNANDVYTIFEGDYDIDMADYFWGGSDAWFENIKRQQKIWVPAANVEAREQTSAIELGSKNHEVESRKWQELNANQRSLAELRGVVQATSGSVKYLDNIAETLPDGNKILIRSPKFKPGENGYFEVRIDWDNGDFHMRQALEGQLLLDMSSPDPSIVGKKKDWRWDFLFPRKKKSLSKDDFLMEDGTYNTTALRSFLSAKTNRDNINTKDLRARIFRKWEMINGVMEEIDLNTHDIDLLKGMMGKYSEMMRVIPGRKVYTSGDPKKASYEQMLDGASKYFTHAKSFEYSMFNKLEWMRVEDDFGRNTNFKYQNFGIGHDLMKEYWAPKQPIKTYKDGSIKPNKFKNRYYTQSPIPKGVVENMRRIYEGKEGSLVEKMLRKIYTENPFSIAHEHLEVLTGDSFYQQEKLMTHLLHNPGMSIENLNDFVPAFKGALKHDLDLIKRLKTQAYYLKKGSYFKSKQVKLNWLNGRIKELEQKLKPLLTKDYFKSKSARDIGTVKLVEIESDANVIDGTVQYFTTAHMARSIYVNHGKLNYKGDLKMMRQYYGKNYGDLDMQAFQDFGRKKLIDVDTKEYIGESRTAVDIEVEGEQLLTSLVMKHGSSFLWDFMTPAVSSIENKIGIYKGNAMPVASKAGTTYKRGISWLLKGKAGALGPEVYRSIPKETFDTMLKKIAEIDFVWRRFFHAQDQHIPLDASEVSKMITYGAPKWNWKMNQLFANYTDLKFNKDVNEFNPFGMGNRYDANLSFFRALSNLDATNKGDFDQGSRILSYTHQLIMENGYMSPIKHMALMGHASEKLGPAMDQVFPSQVDINTGAVKPLKPFDMINNPLYVLLGGSYMNGPGLTMDPWRQMSKYETNKVNKMVNQVKDMKNVERDVWNESYESKDLRQDVTKKPEDC